MTCDRRPLWAIDLSLETLGRCANQPFQLTRTVKVLLVGAAVRIRHDLVRTGVCAEQLDSPLEPQLFRLPRHNPIHREDEIRIESVYVSGTVGPNVEAKLLPRDPNRFWRGAVTVHRYRPRRSDVEGSELRTGCRDLPEQRLSERAAADVAGTDEEDAPHRNDCRTET